MSRHKVTMVHFFKLIKKDKITSLKNPAIIKISFPYCKKQNNFKVCLPNHEIPSNIREVFPEKNENR